MWQIRHELGNQPPIDRPMIYSHAPNAAPGNPPFRKNPPGAFSPTARRGRVELNRTRTRAVPEMLHWIGGPAPMFWPNFLGKNFGNKNSGTVGHYLPRDPSRNA